MTAENFCYWLQGLLELSKVDENKKRINESLSVQQVNCIQEHLDYVFAPKPIVRSGAASPSVGMGGLGGGILQPSSDYLRGTAVR